MDRREAILVRLVELMAGLGGVTLAARNEPNIPEQDRPAIVVFDGDETGEEKPAGRPARVAQIVTMRPEIVILAKGEAAEIGSTLNLFRARVLAAVFADEQLLALTFKGEGISYAGGAVAVARERKLSGELGLQLAIAYVLEPYKLT